MCASLLCNSAGSVSGHPLRQHRPSTENAGGLACSRAFTRRNRNIMCLYGRTVDPGKPFRASSRVYVFLVDPTLEHTFAV